MEFVKKIFELDKNDLRAGGKGASLGELAKMNILVPDGFVILSGAFEAFLRESNIKDEIRDILLSVERHDRQSVLHASSRIAGLIAAAQVPAALRREIEAAFAALGADYVAVRSSATVEDSAAAAWAGQFESYLQVAKPDLIQSVKKCWGAAFGPRALAYQYRGDHENSDIGMAVVVQKMVQSEVSGVAFSANPARDDGNSEIVIEACAGFGEALVSGQITPDRYLVVKEPLHIRKKNIHKQEKMLVCEAGENRWQNTPEDLIFRQKLSDAEIINLSKAVLAIESHYGFPVDVEWAVENGRIFIVQCRPITTRPRAKKEKYVWSNFNMAEVLPGINPPLVTSFLIGIFNPAAGRMFGIKSGVPIMRDIKGRLYLNLTVLEKRMAEIIKNDNFSITNFFGGNQKNRAHVPVFSWRAKIGLGVFGLKMLVSSFLYQRRFGKNLGTMESRADLFRQRAFAEERLEGLIALQREIFDFLNTMLKYAFKAMVYPFSAYFLFLSITQKWLKSAGNKEAHLLLATGREELQLVRAFHELWNLSRKIKKARPYLSVLCALVRRKRPNRCCGLRRKFTSGTKIF